MMQTTARYIPTGAAKVGNKSGTATAYLYSNGTHFCAIGYAGKSDKPGLHYRYRTEAARAASVAKFLRAADETAAYKADRRADKKAALSKPMGLTIGDVLECSWGYDQTNIDYYQVTAIVGARMVEIREIGSMIEQTGSMAGNSVPAVNNFTGPAMRKAVRENDSVRISSYSSAYKLDCTKVAGMTIYKASSWTAYA